MAEIAIGALIFALGVLFGASIVQNTFSKIFNKDLDEENNGVQ